MSTEDNERQRKRRILVEIRGYLEIDAETPETANRAAEEWIVAAGRGEKPPSAENGLRVRWLRIEPQSDDNIGWPPLGSEG